MVLTPCVLRVSLPKCAPAILASVRVVTVLVDGVGHICSPPAEAGPRQRQVWRAGAFAQGVPILRCS